MAKLTQNISKLVFRRNIPFKLETYILNCEMLQVLAEMDGIKTVAAIAAELNKQVGDLVNAFAALYQQKLIFLVKPNLAAITQPIPKVQVADESKKSVGNGLEKESMQREPSDLPKKDAGRHPTEQSALQPACPRKKTGNQFNSAPLNTTDDSNSGRPGRGPFPKGSLESNIQHDAKARKSDVDIFSINKPGSTDPRRTVNPMLPTEQSSRRFKHKKGNISLSVDPKKQRPGAGAAEYFEKGLAFLRRRSYKEALHQFESALELDPQHRLCRANIQRIRKLLNKDKSEHYNIPQ